jgi:SAM-dependent methyltransferase
MIETAANARFWDRNARKYAADPIKDLPGYERTVERARSLLRSTDRVLELGCGTGSTALKLARSVSHLVGTDLSPEMVAIAREKAANCTNVEFDVSPAEHAPGEPESYDAVLAFNVLHLILHRESVLNHVGRLLRPGGLFITKTPCMLEMNSIFRIVVPIMRWVGLAPEVAFFTSAELESEMVAAGLSILERARHGSEGNDARVFLVARKPECTLAAP